MNYYCPFCQERCYKLTWDGFWVHCNVCSIRFAENDPQDVVFIVEITGKRYELHIAPNYTAVFELVESYAGGYDMMYTDLTKVVRVDYPIKGVTPQNAVDKIKTLLVFS